MLQRQQGASITELAEATGWLPHTTRAALTGLRKRGHVIAAEKQEGVSRYRLLAAG
jgi:DNA-binding IclR family transcriptional regulator